MKYMKRIENCFFMTAFVSIFTRPLFSYIYEVEYDREMAADINTAAGKTTIIFKPYNMCQMSFAFSGSSDSLLHRAKTEMEKSGGSFAGNSTQGDFHAKTPLGSVHGTYQITDQQMAISILKKPFLLSCKRIEKELRGVIQ